MTPKTVEDARAAVWAAAPSLACALCGAPAGRLTGHEVRLARCARCRTKDALRSAQHILQSLARIYGPESLAIRAGWEEAA